MACAQAAGCELAIADATFSITRDSASGIGVMAALLHIHKRAQREFPRGPVALGLVALMDFQYARAITPKMPVRVFCLSPSPGVAVGLPALTMMYPEAASDQNDRTVRARTCCACSYPMGISRGWRR